MYRKLKGNPEQDFLEQNPEFQYLTSVQDLCDEHGPEKASRILWAFYLLEHPDSTLSRMPRQQRKKEVEEHYLKEEIDEENYKDLLRDLINTTMTKSKQEYVKLSGAMEKLGDYVTGLDPEDASDKMADLLLKWSRIWDAFSKIEKQIEKEDAKGSLKGGGQKSAREARQS